LEQLSGVFFFITLAFGRVTEFSLGFNRLAHGFITIFGDGHGLGQGSIGFCNGLLKSLLVNAGSTISFCVGCCSQF